MSCGCGNRQYGNVIPVTGGGSSPGFTQIPTIVVAGAGILVDDQSDATQYRFVVSTIDVEDLTASLTIVAKAATVTKTSPILKGTIIDEIISTWSYNKEVVSQNLSNTGGLTPPTLADALRTHSYTGQSVSSNISLTITGNDGLGRPGSIASSTKSISFGNFLWHGKGLSKIGASTASLEAFIEALPVSVIKTSRGYTYFATGGVNEKHFVAYPKAWGLATFTKPPFTGGYVRLKNVGGLIKSELVGLDTETDIIFTNSAGYAEAYYVYESLVDNQDDPVTAFTIS